MSVKQYFDDALRRGFNPLTGRALSGVEILAVQYPQGRAARFGYPETRPLQLQIHHQSKHKNGRK